MRADRFFYGIGLLLFASFIFYTTTQSWPLDPLGYCQMAVNFAPSLGSCPGFISNLILLSYALAIFGILLILYALLADRSFDFKLSEREHIVERPIIIEKEPSHTITKIKIVPLGNLNFVAYLRDMSDNPIVNRDIEIIINEDIHKQYLTNGKGAIEFNLQTKPKEIKAVFKGDAVYKSSSHSIRDI